MGSSTCCESQESFFCFSFSLSQRICVLFCSQWYNKTLQGVRDAAVDLLHTLVAVHAEVFLHTPCDSDLHTMRAFKKIYCHPFLFYFFKHAST